MLESMNSGIRNTLAAALRNVEAGRREQAARYLDQVVGMYRELGDLERARDIEALARWAREDDDGNQRTAARIPVPPSPTAAEAEKLEA